VALPEAGAVLFYISGHGFGHASREVEVINALGAARPELRLIIRSAVSPALLARTVRVPYDLRAGGCDTGVVQPSSVTQDDEATIRAAVDFYSSFDVRVAAETAAVLPDRVRLVVGDVPPLAFAVAARLAVPSIAIANFTWDWIYETYPGLHEAAPWLVGTLRRAYAEASLALELPFSGGFGVFRNVRPVPLIARHATKSRQETRDTFGLPRDRPVALLSFGGYGLPWLDLASVDCLEEGTVVTTDRIGTPDGTSVPPGIVVLPETAFRPGGVRYEDLVGAVDVVVTKPGYGILAECIACGPAMLYTSRGVFREYDLLVDQMPKYIRCRFIDQRDLGAGRWRVALDALVRQPVPPEHLPSNGAQIAASVMAEMLATR
jgi:hypothetical protein